MEITFACVAIFVAAIFAGLNLSPRGRFILVRVQVKYSPISLMINSAYLGALIGAQIIEHDMPPDVLASLNWDDSHPLLAWPYPAFPLVANVIYVALWLADWTSEQGYD